MALPSSSSPSIPCSCYFCTSSPPLMTAGQSSSWRVAGTPYDEVTSTASEITSDAAARADHCSDTVDLADRRQLDDVPTSGGVTFEKQEFKTDNKVQKKPHPSSATVERNVDDADKSKLQVGGDGGTIDILLETVAPYLNRLSFQNLSVLSADTHYHSQFVSAPWPSDNDHYRICPSSRVYRIAFEPSMKQYQQSLAMATSESITIPTNVGSQTIAMGGYNGYVYLWNLKQRKYHILERHPGPVAYMTYSQNGSVLATCSYDGPVRIWRTSASGSTRISSSNNNKDDHGYRLVRIVRQLKTTSTNNTNINTPVIPGAAFNNSAEAEYSAITSLALSPDGTILAAGCLNSTTHDQYQIVLWDISVNITDSSEPIIIDENSESNSRPIHVIRGQGLWVKSIQFAPDGKSLIAISGSTHVRIWDLHLQNHSTLNSNTAWPLMPQPPPTILEGHSGRVNSVTFSPNGQYIATASDDGTIRLWTTSITTATIEVDDEEFGSTATGSPNGRYRCTMVFPHPFPARSLAFSPNNKYLVSACSGAARASAMTTTTEGNGEALKCMIKIWNLGDGTCSRTIPGPRDDSIMSLTVSPDGQVVVFVGFDGSIGFRRVVLEMKGVES